MNRRLTNQRQKTAPARLALLAMFGAAQLLASTLPGAARQVEHRFSQAAGGQRSFFLVEPDEPRQQSRSLVIVFAGTDTTGREMHEWLGRGWTNGNGFEKAMGDALIVYPDQKYRWDGDGGWALGPEAGDYAGSEDIRFIDELIALLQRDYSIDETRIFATGHSWGGDMAAVAGCELGDKLRAVAPMAANRPYWFGSPPVASRCKGRPAVWTIFGLRDDNFGDASPDGAFGREQDAFWRRKNGCSGESTLNGETVTYGGCAAPVLLTLYKGGQYSGGGGLADHQPPDWLPAALAAWFRSF